ncbi:hypothetical protein BC834DRAFT_974300 [Gloeopeniophorella convolvens]|nr:hypothetical protein BC834DRAFT_974300 [Gloeopeniophorella convolvens]
MDESHLSVFPREIILRVFDLSDLKTLLTCQLVCRGLRELIVDSVAWQYKIALIHHGMIDNESSGVAKADRLAMLLKYDDAWRTGKWTKHEAIDIRNLHDPYISDGVVGFRLKESRSSLKFYEVPCSLRGKDGRQWQLDFEFPVSTFIFDVAQDLLVISRGDEGPLTEPFLYMLTLSAGERHPLCVHEGSIQLPYQRSMLPEIRDISNIYGNYLGMLTIKRDDYFATIWDWKTGVRWTDWRMEIPSYDFRLLDETHFVLDMRPPNPLDPWVDTLSVYRFKDFPDDEPGRVGWKQPRLKATFVLTAIQPCVHSGRRTWFVNNNVSSAATTGHFYPDVDQKVLTVVVNASTSDRYPAGHIYIHVPPRVLTHWRGGELPLSGRPPVVPWADWADQTLHYDLTPTWGLPPPLAFDPGLAGIPSTFGMRSVMRYLKPDSTITFSDLHRRRVLRAIKEDNAKIAKEKFLRSPSGLHIVSGADLPPALKKVQRSFLCPAVCGDAIVVFQAKELEFGTDPRQIESLHVLSF